MLLYRIKDYSNNIIYVFLVFNYLIFSLLKLNLIFRIISMLLIIRGLFIFIIFVLMNKPFIVKRHINTSKKLRMIEIMLVIITSFYILFVIEIIDVDLFSNYYINYIVDYTYSIVIYCILLFFMLSYLIYNYLIIKI